jgi:hypothetical protein
VAFHQLFHDLTIVVITWTWFRTKWKSWTWNKVPYETCGAALSFEDARRNSISIVN